MVLNVKYYSYAKVLHVKYCTVQNIVIYILHEIIIS